MRSWSARAWERRDLRANRNYVPLDFIVLDIDCNPTCPIILGRPFLRTIGAIIVMNEGNIRMQFPLRYGTLS